jgi:hypothetical protein
LVGGRIEFKVCSGCAKSGLTIAIKMSQRRQFGPRRRIKFQSKLSYSSTKTFAAIWQKHYATILLLRYESFINKTESEMPEIEARCRMKEPIQLRHSILQEYVANYGGKGIYLKIVLMR